MRHNRFSAPGIAGALAVVVVCAACGGGDKQAAPDTAAAAVMTPAGSTSAPASVAKAGPPPAGATPAMVALGDSIFHGTAAGGLCFTCHGADAGGGPLAPSLADTTWLTGDGSYAFIQKRVTEGMPTPTAPYTTPMLPKGGANLTADQVKAVAAYVYTLSHAGG